MSLDIERPGSGPAAELSPVDANREQVGEIIDAEQAVWQSAIDAGDGSAIHHQAEIKLLGEMAERIDFLVYHYMIGEPVDAEFVHEVIDYLKAADFDRDWSDTSPSRTIEIEAVSQAVQNLELRNAGMTVVLL